MTEHCRAEPLYVARHEADLERQAQHVTAASTAHRTRAATAAGHRRNLMSSDARLPRPAPSAPSFLATRVRRRRPDSELDKPRAREMRPSPSDRAARCPVTWPGRASPRPRSSPRCTHELLENAGYDVDAKLVDARDAYMATFPGGVDVVPEYVGGIVNFLNASRTATTPSRSRPATAKQLADGARALLEEAGHRRCSTSSEATDTNAYFVTEKFAEQQRRHQAVRPRRAISVTLAAAADCEGRLDCEGGLTDEYGIDITKVLPLGFASDADLPVGDQRRVRARPDQHHRRHAGVAGPGAARGRQGHPAGAEPRAGGLGRSSSPRTRTSPTSSTR